MTSTTNGHDVNALLLKTFDDAWARLRSRLDGLGAHEYLWEPVEGCWSVRERDAQWVVVEPGSRIDPEPAPVTTIAWRIWHIAVPCLAHYTSSGLGPWPLPVTGADWFGDPGEAIAGLEAAWSAFRSGVAALGPDDIWRPLGPAWGPYADEPWAGLVAHALDEVAHHGAEIALLRDLYRAGGRQVGLPSIPAS